MVTKGVFVNFSIGISLTTLFAAPNSDRWNPMLSRPRIPSSSRSMRAANRLPNHHHQACHHCSVAFLTMDTVACEVERPQVDGLASSA